MSSASNAKEAARGTERTCKHASSRFSVQEYFCDLYPDPRIGFRRIWPNDRPTTHRNVGRDGESQPFGFDATRFNGSPDACSQIHAAIVQVNSTTNNGVVDARGFTGPVQCSSNMFPSNATGKLLLGNVVLNASVTQVQPPLFQVEGVGWSLDDTASNTVIRACKTAGTNCAGALGGLSLIHI